jgi:hypothetical protein
VIAILLADEVLGEEEGRGQRMVLHLLEVRAEVFLEAEVEQGGVEDGREEGMQPGRRVSHPQTAGGIGEEQSGRRGKLVLKNEPHQCADQVSACRVPSKNNLQGIDVADRPQLVNHKAIDCKCVLDCSREAAVGRHRVVD